MNAELWAEIKRLHRIERRRVSDIARQLRVDRKTVRKALVSERVPVAVRLRKEPTLLMPFTGYLQERLKAYPHLPATVLYQELQPQGYLGSLRILQDHLKGIRRQSKEVFLRIETTPGEQAQCDWANCGTVKIGRVLRKLSAFVMVLSYSRLLYVEFTLSQCLEDFIQCHLNAFQFFGGVPKKILYDNLKAVVLARLGADIRFNPAFMEFAGVCGFEPVPCNVRRGNEKGKVENGIYYLRVNFMPGRVLRWPDVNEQVQAWLAETANVRKHRTTGERPVSLWESEKPFLIPLPTRPFDATITRAVRSSHQALVRFEGNFYSVPHAYAYKTLILKATPTHMRLLSDTTEVAIHPRTFDRGVVVENPKHYEGILRTKRKHFGLILTKRFRELGPLANTFMEGLLRTESRPAQHLQQILNLIGTYGRQEVLSALEHAASCNVYGSNYVKSILLQRRAARGLPEIPSIHIPQRPDWNELTTEDPDLSVYDQAMEPKPTKEKDDDPDGQGVPA
jgi:transposase